MDRFVATTDFVCLVALVAALVVAAASDLRTRIVPNGCAAAIAVAGALRALVRATAGGAGAGALVSALLGVAVVFAVMLCAALFSSRGGRGRGVGGGDIKLLAAVGAWTGPVLGLATVGLSCLVGVAGWFAYRVAVALYDADRPVRPGIPLAPSIAVVSLFVVLVGVL